MSNFSEFLNKKRGRSVTSGYNDSVIAPELVSKDSRISSEYGNLQYISKDEVDLVKGLTGIDDSVSFDDAGEAYVTPIHLEPEIEAVLNKNRSDRVIPNNGPFYADQNGRKVQASEVLNENVMLKTALKKALARNQYLLAERVDMMNQLNELKLVEVLRIKTSQVKSLATLMQKKGMIDGSDNSLHVKIGELSNLDNNAFLAIKQLVLTTPNHKQVRASQSHPQLSGLFNTQLYNRPHTQDTPDIASRLTQLPWNRTQSSFQ